jgi:lysyl-tRNA synthetase class 2
MPSEGRTPEGPPERPRLVRIRPYLERRALVLQTIRSFFAGQGFLEVDTPVRVAEVAPEEHITPFRSEGWSLSTSPELHMKRLLAAGYERLFQIARCFRKGEAGRHHNPEFTMLEWYRAGGDYQQVVRDTEALTLAAAERLGLGTEIEFKGQRIDLRTPWRRVTVRDAFRQAAGWDPIAAPDPLRFDVDLATRVIPVLETAQPIVLEGYPAAMAALARLRPDDPAVAERAEVFIGGLEIANAYTELNDPREQRSRFEAEVERIREQGREASLPRRFLEAIETMPSCGGIALGVDRLVMLMCGTDAIEDVIAFPADAV